MKDMDVELSALCEEIKGLRSEIRSMREILAGQPEPVAHTENVMEIEEQEIKPSQKGESLDRVISNMLYEFGFKAHLSGYRYLREAIKMIYLDRDNLNGITKVLYPSIADKHNTTSSRVERAVRHAIENAWYQTKLINLNSRLVVKPTNSEFLALVIEKMLLEHQVESA